ncbi:transcription factor S-II, central domain-containing protein [Gilbertella persicaria]|uniref:transcription factor S-II, central domain-containing protein n=1 Tax=Gilbertella persicaria TaxID=101096 RepID=UPI0022200212|nr:transcription factor S-II, central domain-containing protein [Gilbertella persicaria]KAI8067710.1 transcription factor S-II, central domain-containing protein [Gilbertella persicaria]
MCVYVETKIQEQESPITDTAKTRQTRHRTQSQCLFSGCSNRTRADSFCSDVCARKHNESLGITPEQKPRTTRRASMRTAAISVSPKQKEDIKTVPSDNEQHDNDSDAHIEEEEEEEEKQKEGSKTPPMDPSQMTEQQNPVRRNVIKNLTTILKSLMNTAMEKNPDMYDTDITVDERAENLAKSIENTMLQELGDLGKGQRHRTCGERYKNKFRSLLYNLKDKANQVFQLRVITHDLSPSELVSMSSEDMANPELKSMSELLREKGLKNSVMKLENVPIIKKTHKGDIIMVPKEENQNSMYSEQVQRELTKIETKANSSVEEKKPSISSFSPTNSNNGKVDPLDDILARIGIPANDESGVKRSSITMDNTDQEAKKRKVTLDVEQLLGEEEPFKVDEVDVNEPADKQDKKEEVMEVNKKEVLPTIWHGRVNMPQVAEFEASARQIGGRILSEAEWNDVLSPTMWIEGRIPTDRVTNYVTQTQYSTSREIILIEVEAQGGDNDPQSQTLLRYLDSRKRYAVVGHNKTKIKDFYLIPLYKVQQIPDCLYVVRVEETKRTSDLFLGVLVLTKQHQPENPSTNIPPQLLNVISQIPAIQQSSYVYPSSQPYQDSTYTSSPQQQQQQQPYYYRQNKSYQ